MRNLFNFLLSEKIIVLISILFVLSFKANSQHNPIGFLDHVDPHGGNGWAYDEDAGTAPIHVHVYIDGRLYADVIANESRPDLVSAGVTPNPEHGFSFTISGFDTSYAHEVIVYAIMP